MTLTGIIPFAIFGLFVWQFTPRGQKKWLRLHAFWAPLLVAVWRDVVENPIRHTYRIWKFKKDLNG